MTGPVSVIERRAWMTDLNRRQMLVGSGAAAMALTVSGRYALAQDASPVPDGARLFELPGDSVYPEGIAYDDATGLFYTGSTNNGTLFQGDVNSGEVTILSEDDPSRSSAVGMALDGAGHLIVAGGGTNSVAVLDVATGQTVATFNGAFDPAFLNDVAVAPNGDAYITDSMNPVLYRIGAENIAAGGDLEQFVDFTGTPFEYGEPGSFNANGIDVTDDGAYAVIVNTGAGQLFRVDLASGDVAEIAIDGEPVLNGDGLEIDGQTLYVMRNAMATVVRLELDADLTTATQLDTFTDASFAFPTTMALVDSTRMLVVNAQFDRRQSGDPVLPFTVTLIDIPPVGETPVASPISS
jgi:Cu-Zn family superoxide dismutase